MIDPLIEELRELRLDAGVSQGEVSEKTGLTKASISRLECGHHGASLHTARVLADVLGYDIVLRRRA